jgi:hypothetical protein
VVRQLVGEVHWRVGVYDGATRQCYALRGWCTQVENLVAWLGKDFRGVPRQHCELLIFAPMTVFAARNLKQSRTNPTEPRSDRAQHRPGLARRTRKMHHDSPACHNPWGVRAAPPANPPGLECHEHAAYSGPIVEAFPNAFLAVLTPETELLSAPRLKHGRRFD